MLNSKVTDAAKALSNVRDGATVAVSGFNMVNTPEYLILELYRRYTETGHPKNIFIISDALPAVPGRALDSVANNLYLNKSQDFLRGILMPFLGFSPWLQRLAAEDRIECYAWPIGITAYWFREVASGRPGLLTRIGIDTFLDPRREGACLNGKAKEGRLCRVSVYDIEGEEYLLYRGPKPDYALVRATTADEDGNLSMEDEGTRGTVLSIAQAAKAVPSKGMVIAQVKWLTKLSTINPRDVDVPSPLVDLVTVAPRQYHWQTGTIEYDPSLSYRVVPPAQHLDIAEGLHKKPPSMPEKVIVRRVLMELVRLFEKKQAPVLVNLGIGIPALVSAVAAEERVTDYIHTVLESGIWGGMALSGLDFGLAISPFAISTIPDMFSNFEGGIIDAASLGFLQIDREGNVNPSMLEGRVFGPGGFPVIAGGAPRAYFAGSFTAGTSQITVNAGKLRILRNGPIRKFVGQVYRVFFSGREGMKHGREILYITERAVFGLTEDGVILKEVAAGLDIDKDVISLMEFEPKVSPQVQEMAPELFREGNMGLRDAMLKVTKT